MQVARTVELTTMTTSPSTLAAGMNVKEKNPFGVDKVEIWEG